jgi:hypothetical protein
MIHFAMGGERASAIRQIRSGKICVLCRANLPSPHFSGEQLCAACRQKRQRHRVYMSFMFRHGWICQFLEQDLKTPLAKSLKFRSDSKVREAAQRGGAMLNLESLQALEHGIETGRGGLWLELTDEQYQRLLWPGECAVADRGRWPEAAKPAQWSHV